MEEFKADFARWSSSVHRDLPALVHTVSSRVKGFKRMLETWLKKIRDDATPEDRVYHALRGWLISIDTICKARLAPQH